MRDGVWCEALGCLTPRPFAPCRTQVSNTLPQFCGRSWATKEYRGLSLSLNVSWSCVWPRAHAPRGDKRRSLTAGKEANRSQRQASRPTRSLSGVDPLGPRWEIELMARNRTYFR
jgi:hypothetical protein